MAAVTSNIYFLVLVSFICGRVADTVSEKQIKLGSSLSPTNDLSWRSLSGRFAFGFYPQGDGFKVGIWMVGKSNNPVVWTADREDPPVSSNAKLQLSMNGELSLQIGQGPKQLIAYSNNGTVSFASMLESGNFVLRGENSSILWQSFDHPTDTILGGQVLPNGAKLLSSTSDTNQSSGRFQLLMQSDGNLVLYPAHSTDTKSDEYWSSGTYSTYDSTYYLVLNDTAGPQPLRILDGNHSNMMIWVPSGLSSLDSSANNITYRATVNSDGVFQLYAHFDDKNGKRLVHTLWSAVDKLCKVKTFCGFNSYCTYNNSNNNQPYCKCLPGTNFVEPSQNDLGCERNFSEVECKDGKADVASYNMINMYSISLSDIPYSAESMSMDECQSSCLEDCYCGAALYDGSSCEKHQLPLRYVMIDMQSSSILYTKVGIRSLKREKDRPTRELDQPPPIKIPSTKAIVMIVFVILGFVILLCSVVAISSRLISKIGVLNYKRLLEIGDLGMNEGVTLRVFSYNELKKATNGFQQELGKGSFGSVYKGTLHKGRKLIAVKRLEKLIEEGEREFQAEMQAIGKTHHKNLVRLLGYCAEDSKRLLVYEFMSNGSLAKFIFGDNTLRPDWDQRRRIALDIAKGLLYLHEECETPIIHCDIKPQNILMDEFWTAKISDFGLAKLLMPDQTRTFTQVRGTRGYVAPEWHKNIPITVKADVYSYGIMLLEIVFCRRNIMINMSHPDQIVLSNWVYKCFVGRELNKLVLGEEVDNTLLENMVKVGLWCIQDEPFLRPSMKSVVLMLEGVTDVAVPPCPSTNSM